MAQAILCLNWFCDFNHISVCTFCSFFRDKSDLKLPVATSFWRLVRYHLGSVAFGSFIIALVQLIRIIMQYIERKLAKKGGKFRIQFGQGLLSVEVIHFFQTGIPIRIPQEFLKNYNAFCFCWKEKFMLAKHMTALK